MYYLVKTSSGFFLSKLYSTQRYAELSADREGDKVYEINLENMTEGVRTRLVFTRKND